MKLATIKVAMDQALLQGLLDGYRLDGYEISTIRTETTLGLRIAPVDPLKRGALIFVKQLQLPDMTATGWEIADDLTRQAAGLARYAERKIERTPSCYTGAAQ